MEAVTPSKFSFPAAKLSEDQAPVEVAQLIDACLSYDSERRPTAEEVYHILRANEPW